MQGKQVNDREDASNSIAEQQPAKHTNVTDPARLAMLAEIEAPEQSSQDRINQLWKQFAQFIARSLLTPS